VSTVSRMAAARRCGMSPYVLSRARERVSDMRSGGMSRRRSIAVVRASALTLGFSACLGFWIAVAHLVRNLLV